MYIDRGIAFEPDSTITLPNESEPLARPVPRFTSLTVQPLETRHVMDLYREIVRSADLESLQWPAISAAELVRCAHVGNFDHQAWIATVGMGVHVGAIVLSRDHHDVAHIHNVWIEQEWRGGELAADLIEAALNDCWHRFVATVVLEAPMRSAIALPVFEGSGYQFRRRRTDRGRIALEFHCQMYC